MRHNRERLHPSCHMQIANEPADMRRLIQESGKSHEGLVIVSYNTQSVKNVVACRSEPCFGYQRASGESTLVVMEVVNNHISELYRQPMSVCLCGHNL